MTCSVIASLWSPVVRPPNHNHLQTTFSLEESIPAPVGSKRIRNVSWPRKAPRLLRLRRRTSLIPDVDPSCGGRAQLLFRRLRVQKYFRTSPFVFQILNYRLQEAGSYFLEKSANFPFFTNFYHKRWFEKNIQTFSEFVSSNHLIYYQSVNKIF